MRPREVRLQSLQKIDGNNSIFFTIKSIFRLQKTIDSIEKPMIEYPTLVWTEGVLFHMEDAHGVPLHIPELNSMLPT